MVGLQADFWGFKGFFSQARNSHFLAFDVLLLCYAALQSQIQATSASCSAKTSSCERCVIHPDGVRDLNCFGKYRPAGKLTCVWSPGRRTSQRNYTLTLQQPNYSRACSVVGFSHTISVFDSDATVEVCENIQAENCTKAVFKGRPADLYFCGPPKSASFRRLAGNLQVKVEWQKEDAKLVQSLIVRHKALGETRWSKPLAGSGNRSSCRVENLNVSSAYVVQIRCDVTKKCSQCPWSEEFTVPSELTSKPVIVDFLDVEEEEGQRAVTVTWKSDGEPNDGYQVTLWKASGETSGERMETYRRQIRLILSYSSYRLDISAVNNASVSPAVSRIIPRREDSLGMRDGRLNVTVHSRDNFTVFWRDDLVQTFVCFSAEWTDTGGRTLHKSFHESTERFRTLSPLPEPLKPHRRYSMTLHTRTNRQTCNMVHGNNSESTYGSTHFYLQEAAPLGAPTNISVSDVTLESAVLRWSSIPEEETRGFLLGYTMYYTEYHHRGSNTENSVAVAPTLTSYTLEGLQSGTAYQVQISGFTSAGAGPRSTASFFKTNSKGSFDLKRLVAVFAVLAVMLAIASPIIKRVKIILWPKIPNPGRSNAMEKIDSMYKLELLEALTSLQAEEGDTKSLLVLEKDVSGPANVQPSTLPALDTAADVEDSAERSWTEENADGRASPETDPTPSRLRTPAPFVSGYTTMEMFQNGIVTPAVESRPQGPELTEAKPGANYVRHFSTSPTSDSEDISAI